MTPGPTVRVALKATPATPAVLVMTEAGGSDSLYTAVELPPPGPDVRLVELVGIRPSDAGTESAARRYHVLVRRPVAGRRPLGDCDCPAGTYRPGEACRHLSALHALWEGGYI